VDGGLDPDTGQGIASAHWHQGAAAAEVSVDEETGRVEIAGLEVAVYAGRVVDPAGAELQADGSIVMGVGSALLEQTAYAEGQPLSVTFSDYQVPAFRDVPRFGRELVEREGADVHGLGETALPLVPAAVGNALRTLALPPERMPMLPEDVLAAVDRRGAA
jgi:CO/xanthine dehydrogenase Mo-binding subunit